eukprot:TRINITY_DN67501_c0_g1_i1.p1 TRINITY_DN67501_c0_g1~~TRINITY_DN67501_c0_g1_i1.p1  ORF type:complete len:341 (+),score=59.98 TRINITY_DN67501_c0_g1_i1:206-1228(+)
MWEDELTTPIRCYRNSRQSLARAAASSAASETSPALGCGKAQEYADQGYWDNRFANDDTGSFDWYVNFAELEAWLDAFKPATAQTEVLIVGCGNSELSGEMLQAGYQRIVNIDISESVVAKMKRKLPQCEWRVMDATSMDFDECCFDLAVDKGTIDALMNDADNSQASAVIAEVWRTLRPDGVFLLVSHSRLRGNVLDAALATHHGASAAWDQVEARWSRLSEQATLINLVRARLGPGESFVQGFKNLPLLREAASETKKVLKMLLMMELFAARRRMTEKKKAAESIQGSEAAMSTEQRWRRPSDSPPEEPRRPWEEEGELRNVRKQPFCYIYALKKKVS